METFRSNAFDIERPARLPQGYFADKVPAIQKWFKSLPKTKQVEINASYLARFGATIVPLELTNHEGHFVRIEQSLSFFLECVKSHTARFVPTVSRYFSYHVPGARPVKRTRQSNDFFNRSATALPSSNAKVYLAQASISDLPAAMKEDVPTPDLVLRAGKGDVYASSVWLGTAPTYTPLHRDPNPNLFVQLAGRKVVRLFRPGTGHAIFAKVQEEIGTRSSATMRGDEMMQGAEKAALDKEVWSPDSSTNHEVWETELEMGDSLYIPKGWWHSLKGVGPGMTGSVSLQAN